MLMMPFAADMMDDEQSMTLFIVLVGIISLGAAIAGPLILRRLSLRQAVPVVALIGPILAIVGSLIGSGAMTLSGHDIGFVLSVAAFTGIASIIVGWRVARPLARDLDRVAVTVTRIAEGERGARTDIDRNDEVGGLAAQVDALGRTLARAEAERSAAEDERRSVVSALSHDLRTPLAALLVSVDALEDGLVEGPAQVTSMRRNVVALERLVEDLFLLARADSGSLELSREDLDLAELIDEALEAVAPSALDRNVEIRAGMDSQVMISGDDTALGRVLRNLLDNATRFAATTVRVDLACVDGNAVVTVTDDGPGFDDDFVPRAFDRFSQADAARSSHGGAGLGLAITHTLVQAHGGSVEIVAGRGGTVIVTLPLAKRSQRPVLERPGPGSQHSA